MVLNTQMQYANNFDIGINNGVLVNSLKKLINKINIIATSFITINYDMLVCFYFIFLFI